MRLPSLDGWRAMAIGIVLLSHTSYTRGFTGPAWWPQTFQGNLGVRVFFVISGLLITYLLLNEADRRGAPSLRAFYVRRVLRIFPVYFLYLAVVAALAAAGLYAEATSSWIGTLTFTRDLIGRGDSVTVHYWSLSVEEQFYLVWPVMLVALGLWKRPRLAAVLLLVPIVVCPIIRTGAIQAHWPNPFIVRALGAFSIARYADSLAVGCLGAFLYRAYGGTTRRFASAAALVFALGAFVAAAAIDDGRFGAMGAALLPLVEATAVMSAIWVTIERRSGILYRVLNTRLFVWLGTLSYSLYVWQQLFLAHFAGPRLSAFAVYDWRLWWLAALVAACLSYYIVERPILRVRDRLRARLFAEEQATS